MKPWRTYGRVSSPAPGATLTLALVAAGLTGCKSDLNQQLLERELRYQEDQIYQLQDELQEKCARLERVAGENAGLRRQLGVGDEPTPANPRRSRPGIKPAAPVPPAITIPPAIEIPPALIPPTLENVPALPAAPTPPAAASGGIALPPASASIDPQARPLDAASKPNDTRRLSLEQPVSGDGGVTHLVVNNARTACLDSDADGRSEGLVVVFEPRDADSRLVACGGDVAVAAFDSAASDGNPPLGTWHIPAAESLRNFRRTSRDRGVQFTLPWPGPAPAGDHVRVAVRMTTPEGGVLEADTTIPAR
jgi:hypothetical protein